MTSYFPKLISDNQYCTALFGFVISVISVFLVSIRFYAICLQIVIFKCFSLKVYIYMYNIGNIVCTALL